MIETYRGVVFPWLCDQQGHLTMSQYMLMFDVASYHLLDHLTRGLDEPATLSWADVRHEVDYRAEVKVGALVVVRSLVTRLGGKSITHRHLLQSTDGAVTHAELQATTVRFDTAVRQGVAISAALRESAYKSFVTLRPATLN